ncbi:MAG: hypothetical protein FVQ81_16350 [Candidatus Glassbacteria bacterium]|nr:hypothetical protein [Candidatus Glassbacteria bacterium]
MSTCIHCSKETGDTNHHLVAIGFTTGSDFKEMWERRWEKWKCLSTGQTYNGKLSEEATEEAQRNYANRSSIFMIDNLLGLNPEDAQLLKTRGKIRLEMGEFKPATDDFSEALKFSP